MKTKAFAKINLSLNITGEDERGYHTLESVFLPIDFFDVVEINVSNKTKYTCNRNYIFFNSKNTIVKAVEYMKDKYNIKDHLSIKLTKYIPTQAGLAGGSSDAAAVIKILNRMYNLHMSKQEIKDACMSIGSDVLFTYYHKPAYVTSYGEELSFIDIKDDYYALLVKPSSGVSTKKSYELLDMDICDHPNIKKLVDALENGDNIDNLLGNSLEQSSFLINPKVKEIKNTLLKHNAPNALMSGSGSSVFTISKDKKLIHNLYNKMKELGYFARTIEIIK